MNDTVKRRKNRVRYQITASTRLTVIRSNRYFSAQLIDLPTGKVIFGAIDGKVLDKKSLSKNKTDRAADFGIWYGEKISKLKFGSLCFDRSGYRYHGRVKAFADGVRKSGVNI